MKADDWENGRLGVRSCSRLAGNRGVVADGDVDDDRR